jgi:uncharacterized protein
MISLPLAAALAAAILSTSFVSGMFGMAGGMMLMGILLALMPVAAAMVLHGLTQMASNGWRAWLWRTHIRWPIVASYAIGGVLAALVFAVAQIVPSKPVALLIIGLTPFVGLVLPSRAVPDPTRGLQGVGCGAICTVLMLLAGVSGPIFDVFFVRSRLNRKEMIATKGAIQMFSHFLKVAYFGQFLVLGGAELAPAAIVLALALPAVGTHLSRRVLDAMTDAQFRRWTRGLIVAVAAVYLVQGFYGLCRDFGCSAVIVAPIDPLS